MANHHTNQSRGDNYCLFQMQLSYLTFNILDIGREETSMDEISILYENATDNEIEDNKDGHDQDDHEEGVDDDTVPDFDKSIVSAFIECAEEIRTTRNKRMTQYEKYIEPILRRQEVYEMKQDNLLKTKVEPKKPKDGCTKESQQVAHSERRGEGGG